MYAALRSTLAVALLCVFPGSGKAQSPKFLRHAPTPLPLAPLTDLPPATPCARGARLPETAAVGASTPRSDAILPCDDESPTIATANPCNGSIGIRMGCNLPNGLIKSLSRDAVEADLRTMGKPGQKILLARKRVLEILETENGCTAWFREKDANPAATFGTLNFVLDRQGEGRVLETRDASALHVYRSPYVAKVMQEAGAYATVTLNLRGAFFIPLAQVTEVREEGGPSPLLGSPRFLLVGPYTGATLPAQVVALLHEFGHVIDRLPEDQNNIDGKSMQNTEEVLRYCHAEVESKVRR